MITIYKEFQSRLQDSLIGKLKKIILMKIKLFVSIPFTEFINRKEQQTL